MDTIKEIRECIRNTMEKHLFKQYCTKQSKRMTEDQFFEWIAENAKIKLSAKKHKENFNKLVNTIYNGQEEG